eukprot:SAG11_NODE_283_length_11241_cov_8.234428_5_plen_206_part_00
MLHIELWAGEAVAAASAPASDSLEGERAPHQTVVVPGERQATLGALRIEARKAFGLEVGTPFVLLLARPNARSVVKLDRDILSLAEYDVRAGDVITLELGVRSFGDSEEAGGGEGGGGEGGGEGTTSAALAYFERAAFFATLYYNTLGGSDCTQALPVDLRSTLGEARAAIGLALGLPSEYEFHLRRNGAILRTVDRKIFATEAV